MASGRLRFTAVVAGVLAANAAVGRAAAQDQEEPWVPVPAAAPAEPPPPSEGGGVGLQILAGVGIGAAAIAGIWAGEQGDRRTAEVVTWGLLGITPAATGLAICNLGQRSERSEPSCLRAVVAAYIGSLIGFGVFAVTFLMTLDWGPDADTSDDDREMLLVLGASGLAWVGGMTVGATAFGRRRFKRRPGAAAAPPAPRLPASFAPTDDPRHPRWAGAASSGQLVFRLLSVEF